MSALCHPSGPPVRKAEPFRKAAQKSESPKLAARIKPRGTKAWVNWTIRSQASWGTSAIACHLGRQKSNSVAWMAGTSVTNTAVHRRVWPGTGMQPDSERHQVRLAATNPKSRLRTGEIHSPFKVQEPAKDSTFASKRAAPVWGSTARTWYACLVTWKSNGSGPSGRKAL